MFAGSRPHHDRWEHFDVEVREGVAHLTLTRPEKLNAITFGAYADLRDFFGELSTRGDVKAVVLTGSGRGFCSGGDVEEIIAPLQGQPAAVLLEFTRMTGAVVQAMRECPQPIVAAVNGIAAGAGSVLALASDLRILGESGAFAFLFNRVGLAGADMGAAYLLPKIVGLGRATELLYFGDAIDAPTAERYGLFNRVVPPERVLEEAMAWARRLADGPRFALGMTKELLNGELNSDLYGALDNEARAQAVCMQTKDFREAYEAFTEKRPARFTGR
jgi:enoyl-CoA hydratase/carnithine racemase